MWAYILDVHAMIGTHTNVGGMYFCHTVIIICCLPLAITDFSQHGHLNSLATPFHHWWNTFSSTTCEAEGMKEHHIDRRQLKQTPQIILQNLQGRTVRVGVNQFPTPEFMDSKMEPNRWSILMLDMMATMLNFSIEYIVQDSDESLNDFVNGSLEQQVGNATTVIRVEKEGYFD